MQYNGMVIKSTGNLYTVLTSENKTVPCKITGRYRLEGLKSTSPIVVGDRVQFELAQGDQIGRISEVQERKNYIIRKSSNLSKTYQVIAANIDQLMLIITVEYPKTFPEFIDRYLVSAEAYDIPAILYFNKIDLYNSAQKAYMNELIKIYTDIGYPCFQISALEKTGLKQIKETIKNKISLIAGNSGVGKSTLINAIDPTLDLTVREISDYHKKGKHTTTFVEMFQVATGGYLIDSPGIKGFGLIDMENEPLFHYFPEFFRLSEKCKYYNCLHVNEPECAIQHALEEGRISTSRYASYLSLLHEQKEAEKYRK